MPRRKDNPYVPHDWAPHEKPAILGSPSTPIHSTPKRIAYGIVGLLVCLTGALGNAVVTANLQLLQGTFAAWSTEIAWLPAVYVMTNVSINLLLVKFRQQFGLRAFTEGFLVLYVLVTFFHLFVNDLSSALMVRAAHGMVAAALSSLGIYYQVQAWPARHRLKALTIGITGSSLAIPLARLFSTELLQIDEWRGLYFFELGLALVSLACVIALKLPPSDRKKVFEKKDFITFFLLAPGMAQGTADIEQAKATLEMSRQDLQSTIVNRDSLLADVASAKAALELAQIDLQNTRIIAPTDGQLGQISVRLGAYVTAGTHLTSLVPPQHWLIANLKETQLAQVRVGQRVTFTVDALNSEKFTGTVQSISPATGVEFSAISPDNATGNFVKIAQRIPVRIAVDEGQKNGQRLRPGMSVQVTIDTRAEKQQ